MERPRFTDHLEAIKFLCKDFWSELFKKQIDNLKTNHRVSFRPQIEHLVVIVITTYLFLLQGTFVLQDNKFRWLSRVSADPSAETSSAAPDTTSMLLYFPCGIIRGALSTLGIPCAVSADISNLPACKFH
ncbi:putative transport protein particle (TRAPP) component [Helianthus debilis subsp. tardiflorus]